MKYALVLILLAFSGCQLFESSEAKNIDSNLFGEWYMIDTVSTSGISPSNFRVRGWSVTTEGEMTNIGVVDSTGSIALMASRYQPKILQARNGKMTVEYFAHPVGVTEDEVEYRIASGQLIIKNGFGLLMVFLKKHMLVKKLFHQCYPTFKSRLTVQKPKM